MKTYYIPLALALAGCDGADVGTQQPNMPEKTVSDDWQPPKPDTEAVAALGSLFSESAQPDHNVQVRPLSREETIVFQEKIELASFLAPYAAELSAAGKMNDRYAEHSATQRYAKLVEHARNALADGSVVVEPALDSSDVEGRYHFSDVTVAYHDAEGKLTDKHTNRYVAYAFQDDETTWKVNAILHEVAHDVYPSKHSKGTRWDGPGSLGRHVVSTDDLVYDVSQALAVVEAPIAAVQAKMSEGRSGLRPHDQVLEDLAWMNNPSDAAWSKIWLSGVFDLYQPYMDEIGWTRANIEHIYRNPEYIAGMRQRLNDTIDEYKAEVAVSSERLVELQQQYDITKHSLELDTLNPSERIAIIIVADWKRPGETDVDVSKRLEQKIVEAKQRQEAELIDKNLGINEVNAAIRRTRLY